jgi:hypothetical protein
MAWDANDAARARWIVPLSRQDQSPTLSKKVTSLLLFTAEKFVTDLRPQIVFHGCSQARSWAACH